MPTPPGYPVPGEQIGPYRVEQRLGAGGMGAVFTALDTTLDRRVALKVVSPHLAGDAEFRSRFAREARAQAALDSPHVVHVYAYGEVAGRLYLATQLIPDGDLGALLAADGGLAAPVAVRLIAQVAAGLADAHAAGLVHRDLKPTNVLLRRRDDGLVAYLADFGIARRLGGQPTHTGAAVGTPAYMAPELHRGAAATPASDVYSLGCLLWATLSGRAPFTGSTDYQMVTAHLEQPVPRLDGTSELTVAVNAVLTRAMAKDPAHRYEDAAAMRDALRAARRLEPDGSETARPVPARGAPAPDPDPGLEPQQADAGRSTRRLMTVAAGGALVAVAVVTGLVVADALRGADDTVPGAVPTSSAEPSPQARPPAGPDAGRGAAVRSLARALRATGDLTDAQSRCVARGLVDRLGLARMVEAGMLTEDYALGAPGDEVPRDVERAVVSASADCA